MLLRSEFKKLANNLKCIQHRLKFVRFSSTYKIPTTSDGYSEVAEYPPILNLSAKCEERRTFESWYNKIQRQTTVEEKLFEINVPRYWGWNCLMLREGEMPYNSLNFIQYVTRTHILSSDEMPASYIKTEGASALRDSVKNAIAEELPYQLSISRNNSTLESDLDKEKAETDIVVNTIHRLVMREASAATAHLKESAVDYKPRLESYWSVGGIDPPDSVKKRRKDADKDIPAEDLDEPVNRWVQYLGSPILQMRHKHLLQPVWDESIGGAVPAWTLDPEVIGYNNEYRHLTSIPGVWPGEPSEFGILSYNSTNHLNHRPPSYGPDDEKESLIGHGILSSFGWLIPLATYQGFTPFSEITYPTVAQTILTDGNKFSFMVYQMNTNLLHSEFAVENSKSNICWCSPSQKLYEQIDDGKIIGLNEDVIEKILLFYLNKPSERVGVNLKPYLGTDIQRVAHYEDNEKRCWLEKEFKHFSANRPRHRKDNMYELYEWERIYKVEHNMRPRDPRRRPFELNQRPYQRKMSEHPGEYIPRALRPDKDLPKGRQRKFKRTFYPE